MNTDLRADDAFIDQLTAYLDQRAVHADDDTTDLTLQGVNAELRANRTWSPPPVNLRDTILARVREQQASAASPALQPTTVAAESPAPAVVVPEAVVPAVVVEPAGVTPERAEPEAGQPDAVEPEVVEPDAEPEVVTVVRPVRAQQPWWRARWGRLAWGIPVAAAAAAVFTTGVIAVDRALQPNPPAAETYVASGTSLAPEARATISVSGNWSGFSIKLDVTGLPGAAPGSYYSAWLRGTNGYVPIGSFHERRCCGTIELWSGVDPKDYDTLVVTLQAEGDPPTPSTLIILSTPLTH